MDFFAGNYDVAVIGAGHAGIEAALASARLGMETVLFTINLDAVGNMPCNPSIGGTGKGHLVREIDALGGEMGKAADKTSIQSRTLNKGKGPAVFSYRVQSDRREYQKVMKETLEKQPNLDLKQGEIVDLFIEQGKVSGVKTKTNAVYTAKAVIIATGTYLRGKITIGDISYSSGPDGMFPSIALYDSLLKTGAEFMRFKTGTPARINARSIDFSKMEKQDGDEPVRPFSFETEILPQNKVCCYLTYTTKETHEIIKKNLHRSPLYGGTKTIEGTGPRYCPSIEDKVVRFSDKDRHQLFIEPMGLSTEEMYLQGMSSSLPEEVQLEMMKSVIGLQNVKVMRNAYAIEYDCVSPTELYPTLEFKKVSGLYGAGQFNGTSGYEEAAAQGLIAGINAALKIKGKEPFILDRSQAYIGTLIDDLVTKGTNEPYRMMTARSEYRLLLRQDNADYRLTPLGFQLGLISSKRYEDFLKKYEMVEKEKARLYSVMITPTEKNNSLLREKGSTEITTGLRLLDLIKRPEWDYRSSVVFDPEREKLPIDVFEQVEIQIKYEGYIKRQILQVEQFKKDETKKIPEDIDYSKIEGLRVEARQKLSQIRPASLGQAGRISGVSPADITVLIIYLEKYK